MKTVMLAVGIVLAWNATFWLTAEQGVLVPISGIALAGALTAWRLDVTTLHPRWRTDAPRGLWWGALAGASLALLCSLAWRLHVLVPVDLASEVSLLYAQLRMPPGPVLGLPFMLLTIVCEELIFRGFLQERLRRRHGDPTAVIGVALIYALANLGSGSWLLPLVALTFGIIWGTIAARTRGLCTVVACHLIWDLWLFVAMPLIPA